MTIYCIERVRVTSYNKANTGDVQWKNPALTCLENIIMERR